MTSAIKKYIIISDSHIGGKYGQHFDVDDDTFISKLKELSSEYDNIIINGDMYDLYDTACCCQSKESYYNIIKSNHSKLVEYIHKGIEDGKIIYITGNHDDLGDDDYNYKFLQSIPYLDIKTGTKIIHIEHGHRHDISPNLNTCCEYPDCCCPRVSRWFNSFVNCLNTCFCTYLCCNNKQTDDMKYYEKVAYKMSNTYNAVIFGHIHEQYYKKFDDGFIFATSGKSEGTQIIDCLTIICNNNDFTINLEKIDMSTKTINLEIKE